MIFPLKAHDISQDLLINLATTDVNSKIFVLMVGFEQLCNGINRISIQFLYSRCRESHGNDSGSYVSQI